MSTLNSNPIAKAVRTALLAGTAAALAMPSVYAAEDEEKEGEKVVITGSRIKRSDVEGVAPVQVVTREDLDVSGHNTIQDFIRTLTISNGNTGDDNNNSFANGTSTLNLRGLGNNATLVLVNGRRLASYGQAQNITESFVDLNSIPMAAIERIEILKDGASALYGADAVAGVVNVILRKDFEGAEATLGYLTDADGDSPQTSFNAIFGGGNDKTHFTMALTYLKREALFYRDREFSESADHSARGGVDQRSTFGYPGTTFDTTNGFQAAPGCDPDLVRPQLGGTVCSLNYNEFINFYPDSERAGVTTFLNHEIGSDANLYADVSFNRNNSVNIAAPAPYVGPYSGIDENTLSILTPAQQSLTFGGLALFVPATNPYNTLGTDIGLLHRPVDFGPRTQEITSNTYRFITGVEGVLGEAWDYDIGFGYTRSDVLAEHRNSINAVALQKALLGVADPAGSGDTIYYNPFGQNDQRVIDFAKMTYESRNNSYEKSFTGNFTGPIAELPSGEIGLAVGFEYREQTFINEADPLRNIGGLVGTGSASDTRGSRDVTSIYAEMAIPATDMIEVQLAARFEDYSDFGTKTTPKVGVKFTPTDDLLVRASWGESFRAPSLVELFSGSVTSFVGGVPDPIRCPSPGDPAGVNGNAPDLSTVDCGGGQFQVENGGNPFLEPEESEAWNIGFVWNPSFLEGFTTVIDFFNFEHENIITTLPLTTLMNINDPNIVVRVSGPTSPILFINNSYVNGDHQTLNGVDWEVSYKMGVGSGELTLRNQMTYYNEFEFVPTDGNPDTVDTPIEGTGNTQLGAFPQMRNSFNAAYKMGDHTFNATMHYRGRVWTSQNNTLTDRPYQASSWTTLDMAYIYDISNDSRLQVGCINCGDRDPVFDNSGNEEAGYFKSLDDPRGLVLYARWTQSF